MVKVGVANHGNRMVSIDEMSDWTPKKITYIGTTVFFQVDGTFYSMERMTFEKLFK